MDVVPGALQRPRAVLLDSARRGLHLRQISESLRCHMASEPPTQLPPEVLQYLSGPTAGSGKFDFLIEEWNVEATRYKMDETPGSSYKAVWSADLLAPGTPCAIRPQANPIHGSDRVRPHKKQHFARSGWQPWIRFELVRT